METPKYNPLQLTFTADPPADFSVLLINVLQRQCEISPQKEDEVLLACKFIVARHTEGTT